MTESVDPADSAFWADAGDESAPRYRELVNAVGDGLYRLDADGRIVGANDALVALTGGDRERLHGANVSTLLNECDRERIESELADAGEATVNAGVVTADGSAVPCEIRTTRAGDGEVGVVRELPARACDDDRTPPASIANVIDEAEIGVFVLNEQFEVVWADETVGEYFGLDPRTLVGRDKREVDERVKHRVDDPERFADRMAATDEGNDAVERFQYRVTAGPNREERWVEHYSRPIESGEYAGGRVEIYYDITDREDSEGSLRDTEEQFQSLVDAVEEYAIFRLDTDGTVISWNEGAREIKRYDADEIVGEQFSTFYTDDDREADVPERNLDAALAEGSIEDEGWRVRQDGSWFWANVTITAVFDDDGNHRGFLKVTRDMTDRHRRERELESELERLLGRISDAFYAVDEAFRFTHVNERAEQLLGYSAEELEGTIMWRVFPDSSPGLYEQFETALAEQEPVSFERYFEPLDLWAEVNVYPSETGLSVYLLDVTERKRRERQLEESNERLEQFAYAASHDLQEPLRMISSYLQLLENRYGDELDADGREFLEFAVDGADRMKAMIDGLLEYSRVESRGNPLESTDLNAVVADVRTDLQLQVEESGAEITAGDLPTVEGDEGQLRQVFQNLFENAIEYSGDEPPEIHVSAEQEGDRWRIDVRDDGVGIDADDQDRVFEVFQRLHTRDEYDGTGIGLALCKRIVERHDGSIWVDSEAGEGATFSFTLPAVDG